MKLLKRVVITFASMAALQTFASINAVNPMNEQPQVAAGEQYFVIEVLPEGTTFSSDQQAYLDAYGILPVPPEAYASTGKISRSRGELYVGKVNSNSGQASIYTDVHTASGERWSNTMTCAHRTAAFGTMLQVTRTDTGASVVCRVNDRGPFVAGRIVDLTPAGAAALGFTANGRGHVPVKIVVQGKAT